MEIHRRRLGLNAALSARMAQAALLEEIPLDRSRPGAQIMGRHFNVPHLGREGCQLRMAALAAIATHLADGIARLPPLRLVSHPRGPLPVFAVERDPAVSHWEVFHRSDRLRERGWLVPASTLPADCQQMAVLRFVVRGLSTIVAGLQAG
jgi:glutamate decarboxylase